jgi:hypothetical protein
MMGWTCCYHPTLIKQVYQQQSGKLIEYKLKEKKKKLQYIPQYQVPTDEQIKIFWTLNILDVLFTYHGIKHPEISEGNPFVGRDPTLFRLVLHKGALGPTLVNNLDSQQMTITNAMLAAAVINNIHIISDKDAW